MKHQQVSVDYWAMAKAMATYAVLAGMGWLMLRLLNTVFMLPRRLRSQQDNMDQTLAELQKRFPGLNFTEQDIKDAEKELEEIMKEQDEKVKSKENELIENSNVQEKELEENNKVKEVSESLQLVEDKKTI